MFWLFCVVSVIIVLLSVDVVVGAAMVYLCTVHSNLKLWSEQITVSVDYPSLFLLMAHGLSHESLFSRLLR